MTDTIRIRALIVDDEPLARERIRELLRGEHEIELIGECSSGDEAISAIHTQKPDLLFLDVQMPELDGFDVLKAIDPERMPVVIFVTAYDQYALRAFDVYALDYLLKPFDRERFQRAVQRAKDYVQRERNNDLNHLLHALVKELKSGEPSLERLPIKAAGRVFFLRTGDIDWLEAAGNYVRLHVGKESHLLRETISGIEAKLDSKQFLRIHRSTIVNIERIKELQPLFHGEYVVILRDGTRLTLSRGHREKLSLLLREPF
jgi:two-component system LytT family response regulator